MTLFRFKQAPSIDIARAAGGTNLAPAFGVEKILNAIKFNPGVFMRSSVSSKAREFADSFMENNAVLTKNLDGIASQQSVETELKRTSSVMLGSQMEKKNELYNQYRLRVTKFADVDKGTQKVLDNLRADLQAEGVSTKSLERNYLTKSEFDTEISKAIRRRHLSNNPHPINEINQAAAIRKQELFDPLLQRQVANGQISKRVTKDTNFVSKYLTQLFNKQFIRKKRAEFTQLVSLQFQKNRAKRIAELEEELSKISASTSKKTSVKKTKITKALESLKKRDDLRDAEDYVDDQITSNMALGRREYDDLPTKSRYQRSRKLIIDDELLPEFEKYMINDIEEISQVYTADVLPRILLKERFGDINLKKQLTDIDEEYRELIRNPELSQKQVDELERQRFLTKQYVNALRDIMLGVYKLPDDPSSAVMRFSRSLRRITILRALGGVVLASLPDVARLVTRHGLSRSISNAFTLAINPSIRKMALNDLKRSVGIYEILLSTRMLQRAELQRGINPVSGFEATLEKATSAFGFVNLLTPWNQMMKYAAAFNASDLIVDASAKYANAGESALSRIDIIRLAENGIEVKDLKAIYQQFTEHGINHDGVRILQTSEWKNKQLANIVNNAIRREIDVTITTPGIESRPLMGHTEIGKHLLAFRSFGFTAVNGVLLSGLQTRDMRALNGMMLSIGLGMTVYLLKQQLRGNEIDVEPGVLFAEGIDRSGLLGIFSDANNIIERASQGTLGINPMLGGTGNTRASSKSVVDAVFGASVGTIQDLTQVASAGLFSPFGRELTNDDISAGRDLMIGQNILYTEFLFNAMENGLKDYLELDK